MINAEDVVQLFKTLGDLLTAIDPKVIEQWTLDETAAIQNAIDATGPLVDELWVNLLTDEEYAKIEKEGLDDG